MIIAVATINFYASENFVGVFEDIARAKGMSPVQLLRYLADNFVYTEGLESQKVPEDIRQSLLCEKADKDLRFQLKRALWLHNAYHKVNRLFREEVPVVVIEDVVKIYIQYAERVGWIDYANSLDKMLIYLRAGKLREVAEFLKDYIGGGLNAIRALLREKTEKAKD